MKVIEAETYITLSEDTKALFETVKTLPHSMVLELVLNLQMTFSP